jgi:uncharacterized protein (DUF433 family)
MRATGEDQTGRVLRKLPFGLDEGIYLQSEAAELARLPKSTFRYWLRLVRGSPDTVAPADRPLVSFLELTSLRAVAALRTLGMKPAAIRRGLDRMRSVQGIEYPLASEDLKSDGVHLYFPDAEGLISPDAGGQFAAQELVDRYLVDVRYSPVGGRHRLATSWEPKGVSLNPRVQRGAPCVSGTRIQVAVLKRFVDAGDSPELLADMYGLDQAQVIDALNWLQRVKQQAA